MIQDGDLSLEFDIADPMNGSVKFARKRNRTYTHLTDPAFYWRWGLIIDGNELSQTGRQPQGTRYDVPGTSIIRDVTVDNDTLWYETTTTFDHTYLETLVQKVTLLSPTKIQWDQTVTLKTDLPGATYETRSEAAEVFRGTTLPRYAMMAPAMYIPKWMCEDSYAFNIQTAKRIVSHDPYPSLYELDATRVAAIRSRGRGDHAIGLYLKSQSSPDFDRFLRTRSGAAASDSQQWRELTAMFAIKNGVLAAAQSFSTTSIVAIGTTEEVETALASEVA